jgi:hypothetical protein
MNIFPVGAAGSVMRATTASARIVAFLQVLFSPREKFILAWDSTTVAGHSELPVTLKSSYSAATPRAT